jgi:hypothetical protein
MITIFPFLVLLLALLATTIKGLPQPDAFIDSANSITSDPYSFPEKKSTFQGYKKELFPNGIPDLPDGCDSYNLTGECLHSLVEEGKGAWLGSQKILVITTRSENLSEVQLS